VRVDGCGPVVRFPLPPALGRGASSIASTLLMVSQEWAQGLSLR